MKRNAEEGRKRREERGGRVYREGAKVAKRREGRDDVPSAQ